MSMPAQSMRTLFTTRPRIAGFAVRDGRDEVAHESFASLVLNFRRDRLNALVRQHAD